MPKKAQNCIENTKNVFKYKKTYFDTKTVSNDT